MSDLTSAQDRLSDEQRRELERLIDGLRGAIAAAVSLDAPAETLRALADQATALAGALAPHSGTPPLERFPRHATTVFPYSPVTGRYNPLSPIFAIAVEQGEQKRVVARVTFSSAYEGPPSYVHGGVVASTFDQVLAYANRANSVGGVTASLTVRYRRPTPLHRELRFEAWTERIEDQRVVARGECYAGDDLLTECEGLFVRIDAERARRLWPGGNKPNS
jgi:acyl-coenzyme A thioesterase PaaI-like protein